ncbi:phage baseplate upper protein [Bacillus licheniformis]
MIYKDTDIHFSINSQIKRSIAANIQFSTQDIDTAKLTFSLTKDGIPLPISQATHGKLFMRFADGSKFYVNTEVQDALGGVIFYVLKPDQVTHYGTVQAELYVNYDNGQKLSVHKFSFEIDRALVDQDIVPVAEYYIEDFEDLKAVIVEMSDEAELMLTELQKKFETLDSIETKEGAQEKADAAEAHAKAYTDAHAAKTNNPHKVTKAQVGLSNVDNVKQASKTEFDSHANNKSNPHAVTKAQIGLSNVDDVQQASKKEFDAHDDDTTRHITADERIAWNAKETTNGAQEKADKALADAKTYVSNFSWVVATMQNGWAHYNGGEDVVFGIDASKTVWVRGEAKGGVVGTTVFTLPENMRPPRSMGCIQIASGSAQVARIAYKSTGEVIVESVSSNTNYIKFDFAFKAL